MLHTYQVAYNMLMLKTNTKQQAGFAHFFLFFIILIVVVGAAGLYVFKKSDSGSGGGGSFKSVEKNTDCSEADRVQMTHLPMNIDDVASFTPYGLIAGAHVTPIDHLYFYPKEGPRDKYPVFAMADGEITNISVRSTHTDNGEAKLPEYRYEIKHSCQTSTYFDLVTKLDQSILDVAPDAATEGYRGSIKVKGGQEVGRIGAQSLDTAVYNSMLVLPGFISPDMYTAEPWKVHTDDFLSYFDETLRDQMNALNPRTAEPRSGKIDYDQPGKLIGNWFLEGTNGYGGLSGEGPGDGSGAGYWSGHLAIFYDAIDPDIIILSFGEYNNEGPKPFAVKGNSPDPSNVSKDFGIVKYELINMLNSFSPTQGYQDTTVKGVVLFQVLAGEKLKVEVFPGKTASQVTNFTSAFKTYER